MSGSGAMVWDWDRFQDGIPVGYDAVYYQLHGRWSETASSHHAGPPALPYPGLTWRQISGKLGKGVMRSGL